ncbi:MAG: DUF5678 domain-containing protein [candidate division WOR-3 bacterium]|nr:DUF5678 domain-containing protein [candidate division WOR-3 bacterium]
MNDKAYNFYITHELTEYAGKWVAVVEDEVVAPGSSLSRPERTGPARNRRWPRSPRARFSCPHCPCLDLLCRIR